MSNFPSLSVFNKRRPRPLLTLTLHLDSELPIVLRTRLPTDGCGQRTALRALVRCGCQVGGSAAITHVLQNARFPRRVQAPLYVHRGFVSPVALSGRRNGQLHTALFREPGAYPSFSNLRPANSRRMSP